ncbi:MAG: DNA repair protein RadC [Clostridia bacterium]
MKNWSYFGSENLTNSELLAIVIKNGTKDKNCLDIAREILNDNNNIYNVSDLEYLSSLSLFNLKKYNGIGRVKAIQIHAVLELAKRMNSINSYKKIKLICPKDIFNLVYVSYIGKNQEILKVVMLDKKNNVISIKTIAMGNVANLSVSVKEIFSDPIKNMASGIILIHNHPSGDTTPSVQDISFTKNMCEYGNIFGIVLIDHIIIANDKYESLKEKNMF